MNYILVCTLLLSISLLAMEKDDKRKRSKSPSRSVIEKRKKRKSAEKLDFTASIMQAKEYNNAKQYAKAIMIYKKLLKMNISEQQKAMCLFYLGFAYKNSGQNDRAINFFEQYLNDTAPKPEYLELEAKYTLGSLFFENNDARGEKFLIPCANQDAYPILSGDASNVLCHFYHRTQQKEKGLPFAYKLLESTQPFYRLVGYFSLSLFDGYPDDKTHLAGLKKVIELYDNLNEEEQNRALPLYNNAQARIRLLFR